MSVTVSLPPITEKTGRRLRVIIPSFARFNIYSSVAQRTTALGPIMVATMVSRMPGWEVEVIDENNYLKNAPRDANGFPDHQILQTQRPADLIGLYGGLTSTVPRLYELAHFYHAQNIPVIAGGQHFVEENIREGLDHQIDYLIIGEGEDTICELIEKMLAQQEPNEVAGLAYYRNGELVITGPRPEISDLERLPLPDFSLLRLAHLVVYPVSWARGCCMHCEFCTVKGNVRCPGQEYVYKQITSLYERQGAANFFIVDDLFGQHRQEALTLCQRLTEYQELMRTRFFITVQIRLDRATDTELLTAMRHAGVRVTAIGYESPITEELTAMNKKLKPEQMVEYTRLYHQAGFMVHGMFIFGYPHQNTQNNFIMPVDERIKAFRRFIRQARIDTIQILLPVPLPGTELTKRLQTSGRIFSLEDIGWEYYDGNFPLFIPDAPLTANDLRMAQKKLMGGFYRFDYMFYIGLNILTFPAIVCATLNIKKGWRRWCKSFRNNIWRFVGWNIMRKWSNPSRQNEFETRLNRAQNTLSKQH